jgi:hypothetical protein
MTIQLSLTAAELAFMLGAQDPQLTSPAWRLLGLQAEGAPAVRAAGLASLLVRGLAVTDRDQVQLAPDAGAVLDGLASPRVWAEIGVVSGEQQDGSLLFESAAARYLIAPRAHQTFLVTGLDREVPLAEPLLTIVQSFLERQRPAVTTVIVQTAGSAAAGTGSRAFVLAIGAGGEWSWGTGPAPEQLQQGLSKSEAVDHFERELAAFLAGARS